MEHSRVKKLEIIGPAQSKFLIIGREKLYAAEFQPINAIVAGKISFAVMNLSKHCENGAPSIHDGIIHCRSVMPKASGLS
jgi:hypothetical protein